MSPHSAIAASEGFVTAIDFAEPALTFDELTDRVADQAHVGTGGLSLGESHLERETVNSTFQPLIRAFVERDPTSLKTCVEINTGLLDSSSYRLLTAISRKVEIERRNSPARTDFSSCYERKSDHYFLYSGFFHQYPFAGAFPEVFASTPVTTQSGNNILHQMKSADLMYISQIELPYLALRETSRLLKLASRSLVLWKSEVEKVSQAFLNLKSRMNEVSHGEIAELTKYAAILSPPSFPFHRAAFPAEKSYLMITDLGHRVNRSALFFIDELIEQGSAVMSQLAKLLREEKWLVSSALIAPRSEVHERGFRIGGIDELFSGEVIFMTVFTDKKARVLLVDPEQMRLRCYSSAAGEMREGTCTSVVSAKYFEDNETKFHDRILTRK